MEQAGEQAACLDCGEGLVGLYCFRCGQSAHIHRTLGAWWHDFTHGVLHIEGAAWRTILWLVRRPGALTRAYVAGQRRRFLSPLALYLFGVFLLYLSYTALGALGHHAAPQESDAAHFARTGAQLQRERAGATGPSAAALDRLIAQNRAQRAEAAEADIHTGPDALRYLKPDTGSARLDHAITGAIRDPDLLFFKLEANGYKFSWALIPLSVPVLWLLFAWRRDIHLFDHAVFVTYSLAFVSLLGAVGLLWTRGLHAGGAALLWLAVPIHLCAQLRGAYRLNWPGALARTAILCVLMPLVLAVWIMLLLLLGLAH